ncbi:hypothetical protein [Ruegeria sp. HKCCD8929]|uniref:hypothetical protein n=1 Tax=Ruegeria sp. HKCCD8929 TaxID=2683006 RepID=UPI0014879BCC|nr:hypothetical protein [Ruegeria sp. HKCCD8929]
MRAFGIVNWISLVVAAAVIAALSGYVLTGDPHWRLAVFAIGAVSLGLLCAHIGFENYRWLFPAGAMCAVVLGVLVWAELGEPELSQMSGDYRAETRQ